MRHKFFDLAFTPSVQAEQARRGSRAAYAAARRGARAEDGLSTREAAFIAGRDSFYLASVSEAGWPYVQHRGGPPGFVRQLDRHVIGWAEFSGNQQYVTFGNTAHDDRVSLFFMDYPHRRRLKLLGRLRADEPRDRPDLVERLGIPEYDAEVERLVAVEVEGFDWNCPQHITPRFTADEIEAAVAPLHAHIAELEARLAVLRRDGPSPETRSNTSGDAATKKGGHR